MTQDQFFARHVQASRNLGTCQGALDVVMAELRYVLETGDMDERTRATLAHRAERIAQLLECMK